MRKFYQYFVKCPRKSEILLLLAFVLIGLYAVFYLHIGLMMEAILVLLGFCPSILSFYVLFKVLGRGEVKIAKHTTLFPVLIVGISYSLVFFMINAAKYNFFPPEGFGEEIFFFMKAVPTSLSFSFFVAGLTAKSLRLKSGGIYFMISGLTGVLSATIDTIYLTVMEPPIPLGFSTTLLLGLTSGFIVCIILVMVIIKHRRET
jgi:hypothetical protein